MRVRRRDDVATFLAAAGDFLARDEARNILLWAAVEALQERPKLVGVPPYLVTVERDGDVVGACTLLPPNPLVVSPLTPLEALPLLADDLVACGRDAQVVEMSSPAEVVEPFLLLWRERTGRGAAVHMRERLYRIDAAPQVPDVPGHFRMAGEPDIELLLDWSLAFTQEAWRGALRVERERLRAGILARVQGRGGGVGLWVDGDGGGDGEPVAMAAYNAGRPPAPARIAPVYTPPGLRRRGYGTAVTAAVTRTAFDRGHSACMLFTDLSNPTSNHIYMDIGYRPVTDWVHARFDTA